MFQETEHGTSEENDILSHVGSIVPRNCRLGTKPLFEKSQTSPWIPKLTNAGDGHLCGQYELVIFLVEKHEGDIHDDETADLC